MSARGFGEGLDATPIIVDTDPGHDDAVALVLAFSAAELEVRAVTAVMGNAPVERTTRNAALVLSRIGRAGVPLAAGAGTPRERPLPATGNIHGEGGLGDVAWGDSVVPAAAKADAVGLMADVVGSSEDPVTLLALGPLTNVAAFLEEHASLRDRLGRVVMMGGSVGPGNVTPAAEFNVYADPEAASVVFESGVPITMAGLDVGRESGVGPEEAERLAASGPFGEAVREIVASYARTYAWATGRDRPPPLYDAVAVAALAEPRVMRTEPARVKVELAGELTLGETVCDLRGKWGDPPNAEVGVELDREAFFGFVRRCLRGAPAD